MTSVPTQSGKVSLDKLRDIPQQEWTADTMPDRTDPTLFKFVQDGLTYDFLLRPAPGSKRLFVMFSGDALRKKNDPPVFQRWSWASQFPGHCVYFSDPTLYLDKEMGLGWYVGTEKTDVFDAISKQIMELARIFAVAPKDIYAYGSSGGGYATLRLLHFIPEIGAIAVNPQTSICKFKYSSVERFLNVCFGGRDRETAEMEFGARLNLRAVPERLRGKRIFLAQNTLNGHHYSDHYKPLCKALGVNAGHDPNASDVRRLLFKHDGGHAKAETLEVFTSIMDQIRAGEF